MKGLKLFVAVALIAGLGNIASALISEDGIDKVTYSMFKGKWAPLYDPFETKKLTSSFMMYRLSGLQALTTSPYFINTLDIGTGFKLGESGHALVIALSAYDRTAGFTSSNSSASITSDEYATNGVPFYTNGTASVYTNITQEGNAPLRRYFGMRGIDATLGLNLRLDKEMNLGFNYLVNGVENLVSFEDRTAGAKTFTNGVSVNNYAQGYSNTVNNTGSLRQQLTILLHAGNFEGTLYAAVADQRKRFDYLLDSTNDVFYANGATLNRTDLKILGNANQLSAAGMDALSTTSLRHTLFSLGTQLRLDKILDSKWYLTADWDHAFFPTGAGGDSNANIFSRTIVLQQWNSNLTTGSSPTNLVTTRESNHYTNAAYDRFALGARMYHKWKFDTVTLGLYPRIMWTYAESRYSRYSTFHSNFQQDVNANGSLADAGDTNFTAHYTTASDARSMTANDFECRLPVAAQWKVSPQFTFYVGATARYIVSVTNDRQSEGSVAPISPAGGPLADVVAYSESTGLTKNWGSASVTTTTTTITPRLIGSYSLGLVWSPSEKVEFSLTFNAERPFTTTDAFGVGAQAPLLAGADLSFAYTF
jgi:hypothetical protein